MLANAVRSDFRYTLCQYPTRCREVSGQLHANVVCADLYARSAIGPGQLSSCVNRVIPWCGVAPVGFFLSREAGRAGGGLQPGRDQPRPTGIWHGRQAPRPIHGRFIVSSVVWRKPQRHRAALRMGAHLQVLHPGVPRLQLAIVSHLSFVSTNRRALDGHHSLLELVTPSACPIFHLSHLRVDAALRLEVIVFSLQPLSTSADQACPPSPTVGVVHPPSPISRSGAPTRS